MYLLYENTCPIFGLIYNKVDRFFLYSSILSIVFSYLCSAEHNPISAVQHR